MKDDLFRRQAEIEAVGDVPYIKEHPNVGLLWKAWIESLPSAQPERNKMSNKEWVDFLSEQFTVSRTSAREMLHGLMRWKAEDNFKKQFSGGRNESRRR